MHIRALADGLAPILINLLGYRADERSNFSSLTYGFSPVILPQFPKLCAQAGNKDEGLIFLLTDSQITNERFLIHINDLLASGNIPDLFAVDEVDSIVSEASA